MCHKRPPKGARSAGDRQRDDHPQPACFAVFGGNGPADRLHVAADDPEANAHVAFVHRFRHRELRRVDPLRVVAVEDTLEIGLGDARPVRA